MHVLEQLDNARSFEQTLSHPARADCARRWVGPSGVTEGFSDGYLVQQELVVTTKKMRMNKCCSEEFHGLGRIEFVYHLDGNRKSSVLGQCEDELLRPTFYAYILPVGTKRVCSWSEGDFETSLGLGFNPMSPPDVVHKAARQIEWVSEFLSSSNIQFEQVKLPLTPEIEITARSMLMPNIHHSMLENYISAKAEELFCLTFDAIIKQMNESEFVDNNLSSKAASAKKILENDALGRTSIELVASKLNVSPRLLTQAFTQKYGISLHQFSTIVRMSHSEKQLRTTNRPLKQIAFEAGYNHASNFCTAFKRRFGITPSQARNGASNMTH